MDDLEVQFEDIDNQAENAPFDQIKIDQTNMKNLNKANRIYRKCVAGKCPPVELQQKNAQIMPVRRRKKPKKSQQFRDRQLAKIWKEIGRNHRIVSLEKDLQELRTKIAVAESKVHVVEQEKNFKIITEKIKEIEMLDAAIGKANFENANLKSQIERVKLKKVEMSRQTESEDNYSIHWKKADNKLEIIKNRVQVARQRECELATESRELRDLITNMLFDRKVFNSYWSKLVGNLKDRRKFLLDMIDRSNTAYILGADILDNLKQIEARRLTNRNHHVSEMYKVSGAIDANQTISIFLGGKGMKRVMAPLEPREVSRREKFKGEYNEKLNLYSQIVKDIKEHMGTSSIDKAKDQFLKDENEGFQYYNFMNELSFQIEKFANAYSKQYEDNKIMHNYTERKIEFYERRISELKKEFADESEKALKSKDELDKYEKKVAQHLDAMMEIMKVLKCDFTPVQHLLGDHKKITIFNLQQFFAIMEHRLNEVIASVFCAQRKNRGQLEDDPKLLVKSLRRENEDPVQIEDVISTQQCAECAESNNVNRYDEEIVYPLDHATILAKMRKIVQDPNISGQRLHSLSKCNLPRSVIVATRRDAE